MRTIMKTSKITQITKTKVRDWPNGRVYYISLKLENGEDITLWKKKEDAFKVGQDIKYEEIEKGKKWKEIKENWFKTSNPKKDIVLTAFQVAFSNERLARSYKDCLNLVDKLIPEMEARINWTEAPRAEVMEMTSDQELEAQQEALMEDDSPL